MFQTGVNRMSNNNPEIAKRIIVIRVRGRLDRSISVKKTLKLLRLNRTNHCVIIDSRATYQGMLHKAKDLLTWGEPDFQTMKDLLIKRGKLKGGERLTEDYIRKNTNFSSIDDFVKQFLIFKADLSDIEGLKPVFRLHPPRKGHSRNGVKYSFTIGGAVGYRGNEINGLVTKMA